MNNDWETRYFDFTFTLKGLSSTEVERAVKRFITKERKIVRQETWNSKMKAERWNYKTHEYEPMELPVGCRLYDENLDSLVACCECGKEGKFGKMYTSREVHNQIGLGYPVCKPCYQLEIKRDTKHE